MAFALDDVGLSTNTWLNANCPEHERATLSLIFKTQIQSTNVRAQLNICIESVGVPSSEKGTKKKGGTMQSRPNTASPLDRLMMGSRTNFDLSALMRETTRTLSNLDFEHQHEMQRMERGKTDPALKKHIAESLRQRHRERREPYAKLIAELHGHIASVAIDRLQATG
jgi:hypothetical protein